MKRVLVLVLFLCGSTAFAQESTIRILGAYPSHLNLSAPRMTAGLRAIEIAWNSSGLPAAAVTTVQTLNQAVALPVSYPGLPATNNDIGAQAYQQASIQALRRAWRADVIVLFSDRTDNCGVAVRRWYDGNFVPGAQGLDLRYRHEHYIGVVSVLNCPDVVAAHEFGHLLGGGHAVTQGRLYPDARAWKWFQLFYFPGNPLPFYLPHATALYDSTDAPEPPIVIRHVEYSRNSAGRGDAGHQNVRTLSMTARSVANFYEYPTNEPPILNPPINLYGIDLGCVDGVNTRHDLYWSDDPATNVPVDRYEVWKSQPIGQPFVFGWTVYGPFSQSYVSGATARARANACSGATCSALSQTYYDAAPACNF